MASGSGPAPEVLRRWLFEEVANFARVMDLQSTFRRNGWRDFQRFPPGVGTVHGLAAAASIALAVDSDGSFNNFSAGIMAIDSFMRRALGDSYPVEGMRRAYTELRGLLAANPVNVDAVRSWYERFTGGL